MFVGELNTFVLNSKTCYLGAILTPKRVNHSYNKHVNDLLIDASAVKTKCPFTALEITLVRYCTFESLI
jgi:hypothetical protein